MPSSVYREKSKQQQQQQAKLVSNEHGEIICHLYKIIAHASFNGDVKLRGEYVPEIIESLLGNAGSHLTEDDTAMKHVIACKKLRLICSIHQNDVWLILNHCWQENARNSTIMQWL